MNANGKSAAQHMVEKLLHDESVRMDEQTLRRMIACELEKPEDEMDTQLIDTCCEALEALYAHENAAPDEEMPLSLWRKIRKGALPGRIAQMGLRAAAAAACVMLLLFGADVMLDRRTLQISQSADQQQALVALEKKRAGDMVSRADANAENAFDRIYLAPSIDALWMHAGYALPLPKTLPEGMECVQAYLMPMHSMDMLTVVYEEKSGARVKIDYWYDDTRENVLLGYENWPGKEEIALESGNTVLRFAQLEEEIGVLQAAFIAPHLTCAVTGENVSEADFAALLSSMGAMEKSAPPLEIGKAEHALVNQPAVTEYAAPQLHFYTMEDMTDCVRMDVPLPAYVPEAFALSRGVYVIDDDWESVTLRMGASDGEWMIYEYSRYSTDMAEGMNMSVEQNEEGRRITLDSGRQAYLSSNMDVLFALVPGGRSMISVHLKGCDEQTLLRVLQSLPALPADF